MTKDEKENFIITGILSLVLSAVGYGLLCYHTNWKIALAVFLIHMGNNIDEKQKRQRESKPH